MSYEINISVKNLNETKYLAKVFSLKLKIPFFLSLKGKIGTGKSGLGTIKSEVDKEFNYVRGTVGLARSLKYKIVGML